MPSTRKYQVFVSPGAIRLISSTMGKCCLSLAISHASTALSQVSHGTIVPSRPGRSVMILESRARTLFGNQPARNGICSTCIPKSPIQPYSPLVATWRFQLIGLCGSRSLLCRKPACTSKIVPNRSSRMNCSIFCAPGKNGNSEEQRTRTCG